MKLSTLTKLIGLSTLAIAFSSAAYAAVDADAASALVKKSGCLKCHAVDPTLKLTGFGQAPEHQVFTSIRNTATTIWGLKNGSIQP